MIDPLRSKVTLEPLPREPPAQTDDFEPLRENCRCPITMEVMRDPVMAADGYTYDRVAIARFFGHKQQLGQRANSPMTGRPAAPPQLHEPPKATCLRPLGSPYPSWQRLPQCDPSRRRDQRNNEVYWQFSCSPVPQRRNT